MNVCSINNPKINSKDERSSEGHPLGFLKKSGNMPHRSEGENALFDHIPKEAIRVLGIGTGDVRLLKLLKCQRPGISAVVLDVSPPMLDTARKNFANDIDVEVMNMILNILYQIWGNFDAVISGFTIHHLSHERKRSIYKEIYDILNLEGVFCNSDNVASPSEKHHIRFLYAIGVTPKTESKSDNLLSMEPQLT